MAILLPKSLPRLGPTVPDLSIKRGDSPANLIKSNKVGIPQPIWWLGFPSQFDDKVGIPQPIWRGDSPANLIESNKVTVLMAKPQERHLGTTHWSKSWTQTLWILDPGY